MPIVEHKPGLADEMLRELAPLLAHEGIDVDNVDATDPQTLQAAMNRAVERRNMELLSPVGQAREYAITTLRLVIEAGGRPGCLPGTGTGNAPPPTSSPWPAKGEPSVASTA